MASYLEHSERWRHHGQPREASHWAAGDKAVLHLGPVKGCEECACQRRPHYGEPCDCEARLAAVTTHTRTLTVHGPPFCQECSEAISEWVPWPCEGATP